MKTWAVTRLCLFVNNHWCIQQSVTSIQSIECTCVNSLSIRTCNFEDAEFQLRQRMVPITCHADRMPALPSTWLHVRARKAGASTVQFDALWCWQTSFFFVYDHEHDNQEDEDGSQPVPCLATRTLKLQAFGSSHRKAATRLGTLPVDCRCVEPKICPQRTRHGPLMNAFPKFHVQFAQCFIAPAFCITVDKGSWLRRLSLEQGQRLASGEQVH